MLVKGAQVPQSSTNGNNIDLIILKYYGFSPRGLKCAELENNDVD